MADTVQSLGIRFERFAERFFRELGFEVEAPSRIADYGADLVISRLNGKTYAVEVKLYRSSNVPVAVIARAAEQLSSIGHHSQETGKLLFTTAYVSRSLRSAIERQFGVLAIGYGEIKSTLRDMSPSLISEFDSIAADAQLFITEHQDYRQPRDIWDLLNLKVVADLRASSVAPEQLINSGEAHAKLLEQVECGDKNWQLYEERCTDALKLLFQDHLRGWVRQGPTNSGMHRFDLIARIVSNDDFWRALITDFRTRYVIFEFKNHCRPIGQGQIYTTEKYLYPAAMRGTAIIVSPDGADDNAREACRGALRENGKLILTATTAEVCGVLRGMDKGENPSDWLAEKLYEELRSLDR